MNMHCGDIKGTYLEDRKKIVSTYFYVMFLNGKFLELPYNSTGIPKD